MNALERLIRRALQQIDPNRALEGIIEQIVHLINIPGRLAYQRRLRVPQHVLPRTMGSNAFERWVLPGWYSWFKINHQRPGDTDVYPTVSSWTKFQRYNPIETRSRGRLFYFPGN